MEKSCFFLVLLPFALAAVPTIQVYDAEDFTGNQAILNEDTPSLIQINLNEKISSYCMNQSLWLMYENEYFNSVPGFVYVSGVYQFGCEALPAEYDNKVSSLRFVGSRTSALSNALTTFRDAYYSGEKLTFELEASNLNIPAGSFIVNGRSSWTIYSMAEFQGEAVCLSPADAADARPGFYPSTDNLLVVWNVQSVRRGCWSDKKATPLNTPF